jgi:hypothetical protein
MSSSTSISSPSSSGSTVSSRLEAKLAAVLPDLWLWTDRLVERVGSDRSLYGDYLFMLHSIVRATVPLLNAAEKSARSLIPEDETAERLADYFGVLAEEERGHDQWLLEDLAVIGVSEADVQRRIPSHLAAQLVGAQYYWIRHYHPAALLGFIHLMEAYPPFPHFIEQLRDRTGFPESAFRSLARHSELDLEHRELLKDILDALPFSTTVERLIGINALSTVERLVELNAALVTPTT